MIDKTLLCLNRLAACRDDLLYFSQHKSHEGLAKCEGGSEGNREKDFRDERSEYEPKANICFRLIY
jgi:hypothetical protein